MKSFCVTVMAICIAQAALANAPSSSLRPIARGQVSAQLLQPVTPQDLGVQEELAQPERRGLFSRLRPKARFERAALREVQSRKDKRRGSICNDPDIQGDPVGLVPGKINGCGISNAVKVRSVSGVALSQPATIDCTTAKALKTWVEKGMKPAIGRRGGGVTKMRVFASYACRTRNSRKGAKISEHGKGRAVDIGAFTLKNGDEISVLKSWNTRKDGKILKKMHRSACGTFGTVLGPESDRFHQDHFHFDTARYRSGSYCR